MIVKLFDQTEITVSKERGEKLIAEIQRKQDGKITIDGYFIDKKSIACIKPGGETTPTPFVDPWADEAHQLSAGKKCEGKNSIQHKINRIAQKLSGKVSEDNPDGDRWQGLIRDKDWREMIREKLRSSDKKWCDYRAGECACYD